MSRSELIIVYPSAGETVASGFVVRGTTPDSGVCIRVYLEQVLAPGAAGPARRYEGAVGGPFPCPDGGTWFASFGNVVADDYKLVALIETREVIHVVPAAAGAAVGAAVLAIVILTPPAGGGVNNPIKVCGTATPNTKVTCSITCGGTQWNGNVTGPDANGNWSATFSNIPSGSATINATATPNAGGAQPATASQNITVQ